MDDIKFRASIPTLQSAITLDGNGDGARLKLDIPRSDVDVVTKLQRCTEKELQVEITIIDTMWG